LYLAIGTKQQKTIARVIQAASPQEALMIAKQIGQYLWDIYPIDSVKPAFVV
jgi:hypothetical protein